MILGLRTTPCLVIRGGGTTLVAAHCAFGNRFAAIRHPRFAAKAVR
jgi:uncharacterized membrane protein